MYKDVCVSCSNTGTSVEASERQKGSNEPLLMFLSTGSDVTSLGVASEAELIQERLMWCFLFHVKLRFSQMNLEEEETGDWKSKVKGIFGKRNLFDLLRRTVLDHAGEAHEQVRLPS